MVQPVVFDMDGVLVDTEQTWHDVRRDLTVAHSGTWHPRANGDMQGLSTAEWTAYMVGDLGVRLAADEIARLVTAELHRQYDAHPPFLSGAVETVRRLAATGRRLAVASSSPRTLIDALLEAGGTTNAFAVVLSSEEVARGKPHPDVYLETARRLGVEASSCLAVEDSTNGLRAAAAAGMEVYAIPNPHDPPQPGALALATRIGASLPELFPDA